MPFRYCVVTTARTQYGKVENSSVHLTFIYRVAEKSLAQPWKETSYSDQDLRHYTKTYGVKTTGIYSCCLYVTSFCIVLYVSVAVACFLPGLG